MAMGGVGEAMLLGAAMGGGSAALTGGDPLKGALMGGLTGGIGGGIGTLGAAGTTAATTALPAATSAAAATLPAATAASVLPAATTAAAPVAATLPTAVTPAITEAAIGAPINLSPLVAQPIPLVLPLGASPSGIAPLSNNLSPSTVNALNSTGVDNFVRPDLSLGTAKIPPVAATPPAPDVPKTFVQGMQKFTKDPMQSFKDNAFTGIGAALTGALSGRKEPEEPDEYNGPLKRFKFNPSSYQSSFYAAEGGIANLGGYDRMVGEQPMYQAMASGGISNLGSYSDGGRMLKGPGDGMSDNIPASIAGKRPARLADGEFVVPADVVSHLGNGSTDAGAKQLYAMMNKVRQARTGRKAQGREINPRQYIPA